MPRLPRVRWILAIVALSFTLLSTGCWHRHGSCQNQCDSSRNYGPLE